MEVLRHLPLWKSSLANNYEVTTVSAAQATLLPSKDWIFPSLPLSGNAFLFDKSPLVQEFIRLLGSKSSISYRYILDNVIPSLPEIVTDSQIPCIKKLLDFILKNIPKWPQLIK